MARRKHPARILVGAVLFFSGLVPSRVEGGAFSQSANLYTFGPDVEITEAPPDDGSSLNFLSSGQHYTAFRGDTVYVVWAENRLSTVPMGSHVFFAKSTDKGQTFGPNVRVNSTPAGFNPSMRVDTGGIIYVAYERQGNIFFTKSTDGGNTFTPALQVVDSAGLPYFQELPCLSVNNKGQVFIAWVDYRTNPTSIFTAASYDSGNTFRPNVNVDTVLRERLTPDISADDGGRVYVVYSELQPGARQIAFARSDDSGATFGFHANASDLPVGAGACCGVDPSLAVDGWGQVGVAWQDVRANFTEYTLRFSTSTDYGQTFSSSIVVDTVGFPQYPSLVWKRSVFWIAWRESEFDSSLGYAVYHISFSYSANKGQAFARSVSVFDSTYIGLNHPSLCLNEDGQAFVSWRDDRYDPSFGELWHVFGAAGSPIIVKGDLNLDSLLTAADVVMELNAVFLNQPFPAPFEAADVNCDSQLTTADVVLHLNATFLREPFPCVSIDRHTNFS